MHFALLTVQFSGPTSSLYTGAVAWPPTAILNKAFTIFYVHLTHMRHRLQLV